MITNQGKKDYFEEGWVRPSHTYYWLIDYSIFGLLTKTNAIGGIIVLVINVIQMCKHTQECTHKNTSVWVLIDEAKLNYCKGNVCVRVCV